MVHPGLQCQDEGPADASVEWPPVPEAKDTETVAYKVQRRGVKNFIFSQVELFVELL